MPAIRGCYQIHPSTGEVGVWLELSTSPVGTLTGLARTAWPVVGTNTLSQYQTLLNSTFQALYNLPGQSNTLIFGQQPPPGWFINAQNQLVPMIVQIAIVVASLGPPVTLTSVTVNEGALRSKAVG